MSLEAAERAVRAGDLDTALRDLQEQVRQFPANPKLRIFLFQLLCVLGQWERALAQLNVAAELDAQALGMAQMYRDAIQCEPLRAGVFAGQRSPLIFGEPSEWLALLIEALLVTGTERAAEAPSLRERAFAAAPASAGSVDGKPFEWIADADMRLGPVCEAVINGRYYWVPFERLSKIDLEAPEDLRDVVWVPAHLQFVNGGEAVALIPTRYPGSENAGDGLLRLARKTEWNEVAPDTFTGSGQRLLSTDSGDHSLLDIRSITLAPPQEPASGPPDA